MKNILYLSFVSVLFVACASSNKTSSNTNSSDENDSKKANYKQLSNEDPKLIQPKGSSMPGNNETISPQRRVVEQVPQNFQGSYERE